MNIIFSFFEKFWITIMLCSVILYLCIVRMSSLPTIEIHDFDKFVHFCMFGGLGGCVFFEQSRYFRNSVSKIHLFYGVWLFPVVFSGLIEIMQEYFIDSRTGDWMDFLFDFLGATAALMICFYINKKLQQTD